ncbi:uncharacterized protein LOC125494729 [Beta vulgaris subsp. vulgaris]|uniref:uncharacterized protein LOC125494729 n=1 Tax=Beta vulgaris subsp. vulgaris TaxID=3555 RepID=UPI002036B98A|nr:uncharacterized protein LOC125494729 [Beta vulgaris subsp. vulgaris]
MALECSSARKIPNLSPPEELKQCLIVHHGGKWASECGMEYNRGSVIVFDDIPDCYSLLARYAVEILKSNRNNTIKLQMNVNVFERAYICFEALRRGFMGGCRPFISLDGCFLKGPFEGQLLIAVGRDGNNQFFPVAWAVVEVESIDSWSWFLNLLAIDLRNNSGAGTVFDGGMEYRKQFSIIAKSTIENDFNAQIEVMRQIFVAAAEDLLNRNYMKWCRAFYSSMSCCDSVDNNMSEVLNAYIINSKHKPIITMLEDIREGLMEILHKKRDEIGRKELFLCPIIQQLLEKHKIWAREWNAFWDGGFSYGVREGATQTKYVVNLLERTCSCNAWSCYQITNSCLKLQFVPHTEVSARSQPTFRQPRPTAVYSDIERDHIV